jgi:hypothetical protein
VVLLRGKALVGPPFAPILLGERSSVFGLGGRQEGTRSRLSGDDVEGVAEAEAGSPTAAALASGR